MTICQWNSTLTPPIKSIPTAGSPKGYYKLRVRNSDLILSDTAGYNFRIVAPTTGIVVGP
jgi:hypothetical protein